MVAVFIREQERGGPKINGYSLRLAVRDLLTRFRQETVDEVLKDIVELAEVKRRRVLEDNYVSFTHLATNIEKAVPKALYDEKALEKLGKFYRDLVSMLALVKDDRVDAERLIEDMYDKAGCLTAKKSLKHYFLIQVSPQAANSKVRAFGWELLVDVEGRRFFMKA